MSMITVLNDLVASAIKTEMAWQGLTQLDLANRLGWRPEYVQRRLASKVPLTLADVEEISEALGVSFLQPIQLRHPRAV